MHCYRSNIVAGLVMTGDGGNAVLRMSSSDFLSALHSNEPAMLSRVTGLRQPRLGE